MCWKSSPKTVANKSSVVAEMGDRLAIIDMGRKLGEGVLCPPLFFGGGAASPSNTVPWIEAYLHNKWHLNPSSRLATTTDMGRKLGAVLLLGEELDPYLT